MSRATSLLSAVCLCLFAQATTGSHLTLMGAGITPQTGELSVLHSLKHSSLPFKQSLNALYQLRNHQLIWSDGEQFNDNAKQLLASIRQANQFGLYPQDYHAAQIHTLLQHPGIDPTSLVQADIVLSHAYVKLASHINRGKRSYQQTSFNVGSSLITTLNSAIKAKSIQSALTELQPNHDHYKNIIQALARYQQLNQNHVSIRLTERSYELGDRSTEIPKIRQQLFALGDYNGNNLTSELFDAALAQAVGHFQQRHGLLPDGILGKQTVRALNVPVWRRIQQLELNLARAQSLPDISTGKHLLVNIPAYKLYLYDNQQLTYESNVVVGKKKHKTPVVSSTLTKIVLSPYWHVPRSITRNEIIPALQRDPHYLAKNNMRLISTHASASRYIDPSTIDWTTVDANNLNFRVRQEPGKRNSLGNIKFIFPNRYSVYLHDTPSRRLFALPRRAFSHGCIRLEDPFGLAETLLSDSTGLTKYDLLNLTRQSKAKTLALSEPIPIHLTYMTAWADGQGIVHFRPDIYNRDSQMYATLYNAGFRNFRN